MTDNDIIIDSMLMTSSRPEEHKNIVIKKMSEAEDKTEEILEKISNVFKK